MATAQDRFQDELVRRAVNLLAFDSNLAERVIRATRTSEREIVNLIRERLDDIGAGGQSATAKQVDQLKLMLKDVRGIRTAALAGANEIMIDELILLSLDEVSSTLSAFETAVGLEGVKLDPPTRARVRAVTLGTPFGQGPGSPVRPFNEWFKGLAAADTQRLEGAIQAGFLEGDSIDGIVRRVRGTRTLGGRDGVTEMTRRQIRTLTRTTVNKFSNSVREEVFANNSDLVMALKWTSTLDGRTSPICRARDGKFTNSPDQPFPPTFQNMPRLQPPDARPPAHPNCRSVMVAVLDPDGVVGNRPFVRDVRTRREREIDFRKEARETGRPIKEVRSKWARENVGRLPSETTYQQWLTRQPASFQDELLGPTRGKLFRGGGLTLDRFVDKTGRSLTLEQLGGLHAGAFEKAGVSL